MWKDLSSELEKNNSVIRMKCCEAIGYVPNRPVNSAKAHINRYKIEQSMSAHTKCKYNLKMA